MTFPSPNVPNGQNPPQTPFQPSGDYAVPAQQDEIERLRTENRMAWDRNVYLVACLNQVRTETQTTISQLVDENSRLKGQLNPPTPPSTPAPANDTAVTGAHAMLPFEEHFDDEPDQS